MSTGDALRAHVRNHSELGKEAKVWLVLMCFIPLRIHGHTPHINTHTHIHNEQAFMDAGDLVPDELIMRIMKEEAMGGNVHCKRK